MPKVTLASLPTVVGVHEGFLKDALKNILKEDSVGTAFLEFHQKTSLLSEHRYKQLSHNTTDRRVAAIVEKAKSQETTLEQLIGLHDFIKNKQGDDVALHIFRRQLQKRPAIPPPSPYKPETAKQLEKKVVLLDYIDINTKEFKKQAKILMQAKKEKEEETERADQATARAEQATSRAEQADATSVYGRLEERVRSDQRRPRRTIRGVGKHNTKAAERSK